MPTHRARRPRSLRLRTAAIALSVGAATVTVPCVVASADKGSTPGAADPLDDVGAPVEPTSWNGSVPAEPAVTTGAGGLDRVEGGDRVATSVAVARDRFPDGEQAAVLASAEDFADALAGSALADHVDGPLLLTDQPRLDQRVAAELADRLAPGGTVWLLGGPDALSEGVERAVADLGFPTERLQGPDRYGTAAAITRAVVGDATGCDLIVASGTTFADGASASGLASAGRPLLFTRGDRVPDATAEQLARCAGDGGPVTVTAVGGAAAAALEDVGADVPDGLEVTEVVGEDRYATSAALLTLARGGSEPDGREPEASGPVTLTSGLDYPDALIGGTYGHPVLLTEPRQLPDSVADALEAAQDHVDGILVVGGTRSVSVDAALQAVSLVDEDSAPGEVPAPEDEPGDVDDVAPVPTLPSASSSVTSSPAQPTAEPTSGEPASGEPTTSEPSTSTSAVTSEPPPSPSAPSRPSSSSTSSSSREPASPPPSATSSSSASSSTPDVSATTGDLPSGAGGLTWAAPELTRPSRVTLSNRMSTLRLDPDEDYVIEVEGGRVDRPVAIYGGNDVVWIGGEVNAPGSTRAVHLQGQTGTMHLEGVRITGKGLQEGINLSEPDAVVQLQNIKIDGVVGSRGGHHADLVQTWNGPRVLRVDRLEGSTTYQGFFLDPRKFGDEYPQHFDLRNIVIRDEEAKGAYLLWQSGEFPIKTSNVTLVHPSKPVDRMTRTVEGQSSWAGVKAARSAPSPLTGTPGRSYAD